MKKINLSKIAAHAVNIMAYVIGVLFSLICCFVICTILLNIPSIYNMLNCSGGIALAFMISILLATIFIPVTLVIRKLILDFIIDKMEESKKEKRA